VACKLFFQQTVLGVVRLRLCSYLPNAIVSNRAGNQCCQIIFLGVDVKSEGKILRVHFADVKVGDVADQPDTEGDIEACERLARRLAGGERPPLPVEKLGVVVLRVQPLRSRLAQHVDGLACLLGRPARIEPQRRIGPRFVECPQDVLVVGESWPAQALEARGRDDRLDRGSGRLGRRCREGGPGDYAGKDPQQKPSNPGSHVPLTSPRPARGASVRGKALSSTPLSGLWACPRGVGSAPADQRRPAPDEPASTGE